MCECNEGCCCEVNAYGMSPTVSRPVCTCGHREHAGMCKPDNPCPNNCEPLLCPNDAKHDTDKGKTFPQWYLYCNGGNCQHCAQQWGFEFKQSDEIAECPVCYEDKQMTILRCNHKLCWDCWTIICNSNKTLLASCPLCRRKKWGKSSPV
jgi:hypothetical protein